MNKRIWKKHTGTGKAFSEQDSEAQEIELSLTNFKGSAWQRTEQQPPQLGMWLSVGELVLVALSEGQQVAAEV